jgi:hypothetical protein
MVDAPDIGAHVRAGHHRRAYSLLEHPIVDFRRESVEDRTQIATGMGS